MMQGTGTGIGRALRTARLRRGMSLEEASRETRVRAEYLEALERESFDSIGGDVYVRGFLRSYSRYLGLNPEKVVGAFQRAYRRPPPPPAPVERSPVVSPTEAVQLTEKRRPNWLLASAAAVIFLAAAAALGILSTRSSAPPPAEASAPPEAAATDRAVQVDIAAVRDVQVTVAVDGEEPETVTLQEGDARSYEGGDRVDVRLSDGSAVELEVNGEKLGAPGLRGRPYEVSYFTTSYRGKPSPGGP